MSYIRTRDNIFEIEADTILTSMPPQYKVLNNSNVYSIRCNETIKEGNNIEDLFDGYAIHYDVCPPKFANRFFTTKEAMEVWADEILKNKWDYQVYGVLWDTDNENIPSLKSVAKLTDKGWELF